MRNRSGGDDGLKKMLRAALGVKHTEKTTETPPEKGPRVNPKKMNLSLPSKQRGTP